MAEVDGGLLDPALSAATRPIGGAKCIIIPEDLDYAMLVTVDFTSEAWSECVSFDANTKAMTHIEMLQGFEAHLIHTLMQNIH